MKLLHYSLFILLGIAGCEKSSDEAAVSSDQPFSAAYFENVPLAGDAPGNGNANTESLNAERGNAITHSVENASSAVVSIMATETIQRYRSPRDEFFRHFFGDRLPRENTNMGSGFIISEDGLVVTNQHVVGSNPTEVMISTTDGSNYEATLIGSDELTDIALLRINANQSFPFIKLSNSDEVIVGEWAIALGNPFGLFEDGKPTVTVGVISAKNRDFRPDPNNPRVYLDMIQTDAAINRGNSGGPLLNSEGDVIGINTFIYTGGTSAGFVGLGFAIPSNRIEKIVNQLLTGGSVVLDYDPGMEFTSMTENLVYRYNLPYVQGLLVTSVNKGGPAFEGGIMPGDVILKIGKERVMGEMHAWALLRDYDEGDKMRVELLRDNELYQAEMRLRQKLSSKKK